jgi:WD40 repeat protein
MIAVSTTNTQKRLPISPLVMRGAKGETVILLDADGGLSSWSPSLGYTHLADLEIGGTHLDINRAGDLAAVAGSNGLVIYDLVNESKVSEIVGKWSSSVAWNREGTLLAAAFGRQVKIFDQAGLCIRTAGEFPSTVMDLKWLPDQKQIAVASFGGVAIMNTETDDDPVTKEFVGSLLCVAVSPAADWIVSGNQDCSLQVFKVKDSTRLEMQGFPRKVTNAQFDSSGLWLANNGADEVTVWDFKGKGPKGRAPRILPKHVFGGTAIAWHPDRAGIIATGDGAGLVRLWDVALGVPEKPMPPMKRLTTQSTSEVRCVLWNMDGLELVIAHADGTIYKELVL